MKIIQLLKRLFRRKAVRHDPQAQAAVCAPLSYPDFLCHAVVMPGPVGSGKTPSVLVPYFLTQRAAGRASQHDRGYPLLSDAWIAIDQVTRVAGLPAKYRHLYQSYVELPEEKRRVYQALVNQERRHLEDAAGGPVSDEEFEGYVAFWRDLCEDEAAGGTQLQKFVEGLASVQVRRQRQRIDQAIAGDAPPTTDEPAKTRRKI